MSARHSTPQRMAARLATASIALLLLAGSAYGDGSFASGGPYRLRARAGAGAEGSAAPGLRLHASIGQAEAGVASSDARWRLRGGFWPQPQGNGAPGEAVFGNGFE